MNKMNVKENTEKKSRQIYLTYIQICSWKMKNFHMLMFKWDSLNAVKSVLVLSIS